jgi:hypothetical protein
MAACKLARLSANTAVVAHRNEFIYITQVNIAYAKVEQIALCKWHCDEQDARRVSMALSIRPIATPHCNALCIELQFVSLALTIRDDDKNRALDCELPRRMRDGIALSCKRKNTQIVLVLRELKRDQFSGNDALATTPDGSIFCYSLS